MILFYFYIGILEKDTLASQPTLSRFYNRLNEKTIAQLDEINRAILERAYSIKKSEHILLNIGSTLLDGYGKQEERFWHQCCQQLIYDRQCKPTEDP